MTPIDSDPRSLSAALPTDLDDDGGGTACRRSAGFGNGTGSELRRPLGYAMVGGLALSQLLTLYTTPVIYLYLDRLQIWLTGERTARSNWAGAITAAKKVRPVPMAEVGPGLSPGRQGEGTPD